MIDVLVATIAAVTFMMLTWSTDHLGWRTLWAACTLIAAAVAVA